MYGELLTDVGLAGVAKYAAAIGPDKNIIGGCSHDSLLWQTLQTLINHAG